MNAKSLSFRKLANGNLAIAKAVVFLALLGPTDVFAADAPPEGKTDWREEYGYTLGTQA